MTVETETETRVSLGDGLAAAHTFVAVVGALYVFTRILGVSGCGERCDYPALEFATKGFWVADAVVLGLGLIVYFVLKPRVRGAWVVPAAGVLITVGILVGSVVTLNQALITG